MKEQKTTRTWREINLNAIEHNISQVQKCIDEHTMIMGVVKADAYGHGDVEVAKTLLSSGVSMLAVAEEKEAISLRNSGIDAPILILGPMHVFDIMGAVDNDITLSVASVEFAKELSSYALKTGKTAKIHIKIDSGMTRVGFNPTVESLDEIIEISKLPNIFIEGIFTHFACADEGDVSITKKQFDAFMSFTEQLKEKGIKISIKHAANSATILRFPEYQLDMVRAGIVIYGYFPGARKLYRDDIDLIPAMTVKTRITRINEVKSGTSVSYGHTYTTKNEKTKIATVPIGYADGYLRSFSNKSYMTKGNETAAVVGRICMDQCMIDVTSVNNINVGDEVIVFGDGKNSVITAETLAEYQDTISYEILCLMSERLPKVFIKDGLIW